MFDIEIKTRVKAANWNDGSESEVRAKKVLMKQAPIENAAMKKHNKGESAPKPRARKHPLIIQRKQYKVGKYN